MKRIELIGKVKKLFGFFSQDVHFTVDVPAEGSTPVRIPQIKFEGTITVKDKR